MDIQPGTRVRSTENVPTFDEGTYVGREGDYYAIKWDNRKVRNPEWTDLHLESEFEVI